MGKLIYVADDEKNIRELIKSFLVMEGFDVMTFADGESLYHAFEQNPADMAVLDVMMPGMDGLTLCTELRKISSIPIIIVSARDSEIDRIMGISIGSDDYLTKPFSPVELVARIKALFRRIHMDKAEEKSCELLELGDLSINTATRTLLSGGHPLELTPTEFLLLTYLVQNKDRAIGRDELLKNVWKFDFDVDTRATDDVVKRLRKKLSNAASHVKIESVWGFGFKIALGDCGIQGGCCD